MTENSQDKDMTVREATIYELEQSQAEFKKLKETIKRASGSFDSGNDLEGLTVIKDELIAHISSFHVFCSTIVNNFGDILSGGLKDELENKIAHLDKIFNLLARETESGNFTEVGDLLRFDMSDLLNEFSVLFPKVSECFHKSDREDMELK